jgi:hypothetical protein
MTIKVIDYIGKSHHVPGPHDLAQYGESYTLTFHGDINDLDRTTWAIAIGLFILRGGDVAHS